MEHILESPVTWFTILFIAMLIGTYMTAEQPPKKGKK